MPDAEEGRPEVDAWSGQYPGALAAMLSSKISAARKLLVTVDEDIRELHIKVFSEALEAEGTGMCSINRPDPQSVTALATVQAHGVRSYSDGLTGEINVALTWTVIRFRSGAMLDIAGMASAFWSGRRPPEEFRAVNYHPRNGLTIPASPSLNRAGIDDLLARWGNSGWPRVRLPRYRDGSAPNPGWAAV